MRRMLTAPDLDLVNLILSRDSALADHLLGKLDALSAALGPVSNGTPPAGAPEGKRPLPDVPGAGEQPGKVDRDNHARIVAYLREHGPTGPGTIQEALDIKGATWARALTGTPAITSEGAGRGRKYLVK